MQKTTTEIISGAIKPSMRDKKFKESKNSKHLNILNTSEELKRRKSVHLNLISKVLWNHTNPLKNKNFLQITNKL